jgi:hypothetical protein
MSARRAGPPHRSGSPEALLSLLVILAALVGGLAAAEIVHTSIVITLVVSLVAAALAIFGLYRWPSPAEPVQPPIQDEQARRGQFQPPVQDDQARHGQFQPPVQRDLDGGAPETTTVAQLLPARAEQGGDPDWVAKTLRRSQPPAPSAGARRAPAPDLSTYLAFTQIAQCPNCGGFGMQIEQIRGGWGFSCDSCGHSWAWRSGMPWPTMRVAPARRREPGPPS